MSYIFIQILTDYSKATPRRKPPTNEDVIAKFVNANFFN